MVPQSTIAKPEPEQQNLTHYTLNYVTSGMYSVERFIAEANRKGVNRSISFDMLKTMRWGRPTLVADHQGDKKTGSAVIFGYYLVDGISHQLPEEVVKEMSLHLDIVRTVTPPSPIGVDRACGSYAIAGSTYVNNTIAEVVKVIEAACKKLNVDPQKFKYFVSGRLKVLKAPITITPMSKTRGYRTVGLPLQNIEFEEPERALHMIIDYQRNTRPSKNTKKDRMQKVIEDEYSAEVKGET